MDNIENSYPTGSVFDLHYERIVPLYYYTDSLPLKKEFLGNYSPRICALCPKLSASSNPFTIESHIIPAALGNKKYFSLEECDSCNKRFADEHDDHLAKMLLPERIIGLVPMRKGYPESASLDGDSTITYDHGKGALKFTTNMDSKHPLITHLSDKQFRINFNVQSYRPYNAIMSILRSVWLAMSPIQRSNNKQIKELICGESSISLLEFYSLFVHGRFRAVLLEAWNKRINSPFDGTSFIVRLCIGNAAIIWCLPTNSDSKDSVLLPTFPDAVKASSERIALPRDTVLSGTRSLSFVHGGAREVTEEDTNSDKKQFFLRRKYPEELVNLEFVTEGSTWKFQRIIMEERQKNSTVERYKIIGPSSAWSMILHHDVSKHHTSIEVANLNKAQDLNEFRHTEQFLVAARTQSGKLRIYDQSNNIRIECTLSYGSDEHAEEQRRQIIEEAKLRENFIDALICLNERYGLKLKMPDRINKEDYLTAIELSNLVRLGFIEEHSGQASIRLEREAALEICKNILEHNSVDVIIQHDYRPVILEMELDAGQLKIELRDVKPNESADKLINELSSIPTNDEIFLKFLYAKRIVTMI